MKSYNVRAKRWARGWELHIEGVGVTQSHSLADAEDMATSYITMRTDEAPGTFTIAVIPEIGDGVDQAALEARKAQRKAEEALQSAARQLRSVTAELKGHGLTGRDIARVLDVTPQRVSQLLGSSGTRSVGQSTAKQTRTGSARTAAKTGSVRAAASSAKGKAAHADAKSGKLAASRAARAIKAAGSRSADGTATGR